MLLTQRTQSFYIHYAVNQRQPAPLVKNCRSLLEQSFTAYICC